MENNMRISKEERKPALSEEGAASIVFEINAKFNTEELMAKIKAIREHAEVIEDLAKSIGQFPDEDAEVEIKATTDFSEDGSFAERPVRYGIKIAKNEKDPKKRVTYLYDAEGMTPAAMDYTNGVFNYGSWEGVGFAAPDKNYPCMVKYDGTEAYKLNPNDYSKKADGSTSEVSDLNFGGNAMAAFVGGWLCQYETATDEYIIWSNVRWNKHYKAFHRKGKDGKRKSGFYYRLFTPGLEEGKARSISNLKPIARKSAYDEAEAIEMNGKLWDGLTWSQYNYIISLLMIMGKTENIRKAYGTGNSSTGEVYEGGRLLKKGQFFGTNDGKEQVKVFHVEALWGNQFTRCLGLICNEGKYLVKTHGPYNFTGEGYKTAAICKNKGFDYGFVNETRMTKYGRFAMAFDGTENTYTCNYASTEPADEPEVAIVGGNANSGALCGFYVNLSASAGSAYWAIAPGLSCEMPLTAQP